MPELTKLELFTAIAMHSCLNNPAIVGCDSFYGSSDAATATSRNIAKIAAATAFMTLQELNETTSNTKD